MAQRTRGGGTGRPRGRPPGRRLPFTSDTEAKAHLLKRGFTEAQLRVLDEMGYYAHHASRLMAAFKKDAPGMWLLKGSTSSLLLRNKPDEVEELDIRFIGTETPATITQYLGPLSEAFRVAAGPLLALVRLHEAVTRARNFNTQHPELWEAMQEGKHEEQFKAALILLALEKLGWNPDDLTETDHLAVALYVGIKHGVRGTSPEQRERAADKLLDTWNRARARAASALLPLLRQVTGGGSTGQPPEDPR